MTSPSNLYVTRRLRSLVWSCLDSHLTRSAVFYAERLYCLDPQNHEARHLFATALLESGQTQSALHLVKGLMCMGCTEVYARCCSALGKYRQGRDALEKCMAIPGSSSSVDSTAYREPRQFPDDAILHCRAGTLAAKGNLRDQAITSFTTALALNPFLWEAFEGLCSLGCFTDLDVLLPPRPPYGKQTTTEVTKRPPVTNGGLGFFTPEAGGSNQTPFVGMWKPEFGQTQSFRLNDSSISELSGFSHDTPSNHGRVQSENILLTAAPVAGPSHSRGSSTEVFPRPAQKRPRGQISTYEGNGGPSAALTLERARPSYIRAPVDNGVAKKPVLRAGSADPNGISRRITRLTGNVGKPTTVKHPPIREKKRLPARTRSRSAESDDMDEDIQSPRSPSNSIAPRSPRSDISTAPRQEDADIEAADAYVLELVRIFARAVRALARYECHSVIDELERLPVEQQRSPWVLTMIGRAEYEMLEYVKAERAFQKARDLDPYRLWDMEIYSTLLWHLQRDVALSFLAQELTSIDPQSPVSWIAAGNCFSLQKDHAQALTCFRRAGQLDPRCAYAYNLSGHESIFTEEYDKAITFFRAALKVDARHYSSWFGLGIVYSRTSKLRMAEYHIRKAIEINPANAILVSTEGMVLELKGEKEKALSVYERAIELAPTSSLVMFKRAKVLFALKRYDLALKDLVKLRDVSPEEANVMFMLGKVYRIKGDLKESSRCFTAAVDLDPKLLPVVRQIQSSEGRDEVPGRDQSRDGDIEITEE